MPSSSLIRQTVLSTGGLLVQGLGRFAYTTVVARVFGPERFGVVNTLLSLSILASLLWPTAAGNAAGTALARDLAAGRPTRPTLDALSRSFLTSVACIAVVFAAIAAFSIRAAPGDVAQFTLLVVTWSAYIYLRGVRMGMGQVESATVWDGISTAATLATVAVVSVGQVSTLALLPLSVGYAVFASAAALAARRASAGASADETGRGPLGHELTQLIAWNSGMLLASNGLIQFTMVFTYLTGTPDTAGQFAAAIAIATPASMLAQAVSQVLIPRMSHWQHEDAVAAVRHTRRALVAISALLAVAFAAVAALTPFVVGVVYGDRYQAAVGYTLALLGGVLLFSFTTVAASVLLVTRRARQSAIVTIGGAVVGVLGMVILGRTIDAGAAAAGGLAMGTLVTAVVHGLLAWRRRPIEAMAPTLV
ncbi:lipopolysaccharide biosynthesis protein [Miniimonas arenae]|uniref:lipopolysaccharide biosynthesis protein n=1 Tax=Miniimonas arenae TaxID=676201 RepID=UPI0028AC4AF2|nr:hypothetical protein [Miniimonas arenae]